MSHTNEHFYRWQNDDLLLFCQLQPKASKDEFAGSYAAQSSTESDPNRPNLRLKIRITAPPVDGKANSHLIKFIAKQFAVAKTAVSIESGLLGKQKNLRIKQPNKLPEILNITRPI